MNPALSIVVFTTLSGMAQGLVVALAVGVLSGELTDRGYELAGLGVAEVLLLAALGASFLHLGHKLRAWRAALMWRTSWMSREVIALPALIACVGAWGWAVASNGLGARGAGWPLLALVLAAAVWLCTAMIYACLRFVQEWAHPLTVLNYTLIGLASGLVLAGAIDIARGGHAQATVLAPWALVAIVVACLARAASLRRNARLRPRSTVQSATGLHSPRVVQKAMGMSAGSFNTREFFHGVGRLALSRVKWGFLVFGFGVPAVLMAWVLAGGSPGAWLVAVPVQFAGILAERWFFFAQARHPQNLYYQEVW